MARGARKSLQEKIAQKEELIEALVQQQKMEELDELRAAVEKSGMEIQDIIQYAQAQMS